MKIVLINSEALPVPPILGGAVEQTLYETALAIRKPDIKVVSPWHPKLEEHAYPTNTFYHVEIKEEKRHIQNQLGKTWSQANANTQARQQFYYLSGVTDLLYQLKPDLIQIHNRPEFISYFAKQFPQIKRILYLHNREHFGQAHQQKLNIKQTDHFVFVSHYLAQSFWTLYPESKLKTTIIPNSVDIDTWHPSLKYHPRTQHIRKKYNLHKNHTALFVGRIHPGKGIHFLLESVRHIRRKCPTFKLLIMGKPGDKKETGITYLNALKKYASNMPDVVEFIGHVEHAKTPYYYAASNLVIAPSIFEEGFCKSVAEAMSTGIPVIASCQGALPELIDHSQSGFLIDRPQNIAQIAQYTIQILNNEQQQKKMGIIARNKIATHFTQTLRIEKLKALYTHVQKTLLNS